MALGLAAVGFFVLAVVGVNQWLTPAFAAGALLQLALVLVLLRRLAADAHPRREELLISAVAILGRGLLLLVLAQLSMRPPQWTALGQAAVLGAVVAVSLTQAVVMLRHGPLPGGYVPLAYRSAALPDAARSSG